MKFGKILGAHITPEWRKQYIQYQRLKDMIDKYKQEVPEEEFADFSVLERGETRFIVGF